MSEIRFVNELGDALEAATAERIAALRQPRGRRWPRWLRPRVTAALAVLVVGGGVATAATLIDQGTTTLVAHGLSCMSGPNNDADGAYDVPQTGQNPTAACAQEMGVSAATLVACAKPSAGVVVYESDGDPDQCKSLGLAPLPTDYATAITQVHALQDALTADYNRADCPTPQQLSQEANADLQRLGFVGWHAVVDSAGAAGQEFAGPCGEFPATGAAISTADAALDAYNHTVMIEIGAPRSILQLAERVTGPTIATSGQRCYTLAGAQQLVHNMLNTAAGRTVPVKFAVTQEQSGAQAMEGRQQYYDQGCTIVSSFGTAPDGQTFLVLLQNSASPVTVPGSGSVGSGMNPQVVPDSDFQTVLTQG